MPPKRLPAAPIPAVIADKTMTNYFFATKIVSPPRTTMLYWRRDKRKENSTTTVHSHFTTSPLIPESQTLKKPYPPKHKKSDANPAPPQSQIQTRPLTSIQPCHRYPRGLPLWRLGRLHHRDISAIALSRFPLFMLNDINNHIIFSLVLDININIIIFAV